MAAVNDFQEAMVPFRVERSQLAVAVGDCVDVPVGSSVRVADGLAVPLGSATAVEDGVSVAVPVASSGGAVATGAVGIASTCCGVGLAGAGVAVGGALRVTGAVGADCVAFAVGEPRTSTGATCVGVRDPGSTSSPCGFESPDCPYSSRPPAAMAMPAMPIQAHVNASRPGVAIIQSNRENRRGPIHP